MHLKLDISEFSDFCFGVKRAIFLAEKALKKSPRPVFSLGPLIHNRQVVTRLSDKGLKVRNSLKDIKKGTIVIRSHGVAPGILDEIKKKKLGIVDATCPFVKNAQHLVKKLKDAGYTLIIIGDKDHPEVKSLRSFSGLKAKVIATKSDAMRLKLKEKKIGVIAQTTESPQNFLEVVTELMKKESSEIRIFNTICRDANMRQEATEKSSKYNDLVIVVGGKNSANTKRLYKICKNMKKNAHHIEKGSEIKSEWLKGRRTVGIVSGASTPRWLVDDVIERLRK